MGLNKATVGLLLRCPLSECKTMTVVAPSPGVTAGQMAKIEDVVGVYATDAATGESVTFIYKAPKIVVPCTAAATAGYACGEKVYFHTNKVSEVASAGTLCGVVTEASAVGDTSLEIHLDGFLGITS